jgi:hypothetical protein
LVTKPGPESTVTVSVTVIDNELAQDLITIDDLTIMITRSDVGAVFSADVPSLDASHSVNVQQAITAVMRCVAVLAPDAVVAQIIACNNDPSAQRTKYVTHWLEEDKKTVQDILDRVCARGRSPEVGETEVMKRMDYTRQRARQVLSGNPKLNIGTFMRLARACGFKIEMTLVEDPDWVRPTTDD